MKVCKEKDCTREVWSRGMCSRHYAQWRKTPEARKEIRPYARTLRERFSVRTHWDEEGCLVWEGSQNTKGYGKMYFRGGQWYAHRVAWTVMKGEIPPGMVVNHKCWNILCVNVDHLEVVTNQENLRYRTGPNKGNSTGFRNVIQREKGFRACVQGDLGPWRDSAEEAGEDAEKLRQKYYGEHSGQG